MASKSEKKKRAAIRYNFGLSKYEIVREVGLDLGYTLCEDPDDRDWSVAILSLLLLTTWRVLLMMRAVVSCTSPISQCPTSTWQPSTSTRRSTTSPAWARLGTAAMMRMVLSEMCF